MTDNPPRAGIPDEAAEIVIERLAWGGDGVGRQDGKVVFVPLAAPEDRALVSIRPSSRSWCRGRLLGLVTAGPGRIEPACPLFGDCGGCQWLHLAPEVQRREKLGMLLENLRRIGKAEPPGKTTIVPSPENLGYRHRARLHVALKGRQAQIGFFRTGSHDIVSLESCPILTPSLNAVIAMILSILRDKTWVPAALRTVDVASDFSDRAVRLSLRGSKGTLVPPRTVSKKLRTSAAGAGIDLVLPGMRDHPLALTADPEGPRAHRGAFSQVNLPLNAALVEEVVSLAAPAEDRRIIDLFCGAGNYAIPLAVAGAEVLGIDSNRPAVESGIKNTDRMGVKGLSFRQGRAGDVLDEIAAAGTSCDAVVVNPPRKGCSEVIPALLELAPGRIVMVSCDPATFSRDAAHLVEGGYSLRHLRAYDLFPQTFHFESVALFTR